MFLMIDVNVAYHRMGIRKGPAHASFYFPQMGKD